MLKKIWNYFKKLFMAIAPAPQYIYQSGGDLIKLKVKNLQAETDGSDIVLTWNALSEVVIFEVYRKTTGNWTLIAETETNQYTDTVVEDTYSYRIRGRDSEGKYTLFSEAVSVLGGSIVWDAPILDATYNGIQVSLSWNMPILNTISPDAFYVEVDSGGGFVPLNNYAGNVFSATDTAQPGDNKSYRIRANSNTQGFTAYSNIANINAPLAQPLQLIQVPAHNILYENERGAPYKMMDEPLAELIADPTATPTVVPTSSPAVPAGSIKLFQRPIVSIYLGGNVNVTRIWVWDGAGTQTHVISGGDNPFDQTELGTVVTSGFNVWKKIDINVNVKWITIDLHARYILPNEIAIVGIPLEPLNHNEPTPIAYEGDAKSFDRVLGENTFVDVPVGNVAVKRIREYQNVRWFFDEPTGTWAFAPAVAGGGGWNFDTYYAECLANGIEIWPCLKENAPWLDSSIRRNSSGEILFEDDGVTPQRNYEYKPTNAIDSDPTDPESYSIWFEGFSQYVKRYGKTVHPDASLNLRADQPRVSGLGYINYIELGNERDKTWQDEWGYFTPLQLAAYVCKGYEVIKAADPTIKVVFPGTAGFRYDYIRLFIEGCKKIRGDNTLPFDVMAHHHYGSDAGDQHSNTTATRSIHPALDGVGGLLARAQAALLYRDKYYPGKEYGNNEYGNDTTVGSPYSADASVMWTAEEKSSIYNLESALIYFEVGYQFADHFMIRDTDQGGNGVFQTSGALGKKALGYPKKHWYFAEKTFVTHLTGFFFTERIVGGGVLIRVLTHPDGRKAFVLSSPTDVDTVVSNYTLTVGAGFQSAYLCQVVKEREIGMTYGVDIVSNQFTLNVNEMHQILICDPSPVSIPEAPTNLKVIESGEDYVTVQFSNNSNYEKEFKVEVSIGDELSYSQVATVPGGSNTANITGLTDNTFYYIRVRSSNTAGNSAYTNSVLAKTIKSGVTIQSTERFNFTGVAVDEPGWTDVVGSPSESISATSNGITCTFLNINGSKWTAANSSGGTGSTIIPDNVQNWYFYTTNSRGDIKFSGFSPGQFITLTIYSNKAFDGADKTGNWTIDGITLPLNAALNIDKTVVFHTLEPDVNGEIILQGYKASGSGSVVINGAKIEIGTV